MANLIITDNVYLKLGLENLCAGQGVDSNLLLVDLDSFHCLSDILQSIIQQQICDDTKVCFFGGNSVNFRVLNKFKPVESYNDLSRVRRLISNRNYPAFFEVKDFMANVIRMSIFTDKQRQCLLALKFFGEVSAASSVIGLTDKALYSIIRQAGYKLSLTSLLHVRRFLSSNFNVSN